MRTIAACLLALMALGSEAAALSSDSASFAFHPTGTAVVSESSAPTWFFPAGSTVASADSAPFTFGPRKFVLPEESFDHEGVYDGKAHGINVHGYEPATAVVRYSFSPDGPFVPFSDEFAFSSVCDTNIWYELSASDYESVTNVARVHITPKALAEAMVTVDLSDRAYTGTPIYPAVTVADGDLLTAADWTVAYADNTAVGTATITVTAKGNYEGAVEKTFRIVLADSYRNLVSKPARDQADQLKTDVGDEIGLSDAEKATFSAQIDACLLQLEKDLSAATTPQEAANAVNSAETILADIRSHAAVLSDGTVRFATNAVSGIEGARIEVLVYGGSSERPSQATLFLTKGTLTSYTAYFGTDSKGKEKKASFPLTLNWAAGDRQPKKIVFTTKSNPKKIKDDRFLMLQLGASVICQTTLPDICAVTVRDAVAPHESDIPVAIALSYPANDGIVSGAGELPKATSMRTLTAKARKWASFAGWYRADPAFPFDFSKATFVSSAAKCIVGQAEAGTYFAHFTGGKPVIVVNEPDFAAEGTAGIVGDGAGVAACMAGVRVSFALTFETAAGDTSGKLIVSKLPNGLKYDRRTGLVTGVPTKVGGYEVSVKGQNASGKHTLTFRIVVKPLPTALVGSFDGEVRNAAGAAVGTISVKITAVGQVSVKVVVNRTTYSFSEKGLVDEEGCNLRIEKKKTGQVKAVAGVDGTGAYDGSYRGEVFLNALGKERLTFEAHGAHR